MTQLINEAKRMQVLAGIIKEGFLDNVAAGIKGKSEQGKLAQDLLAKMGITKNPAEIFALGMEGGGAGPFENEVQGYLLAGGDINTKIPFPKNAKASGGGAIFKETYTFDFSKDVPTMKAGGKFIWNIKGGKWEAKETDGNSGKEEPMDVEDMKKENDADPGLVATEATMIPISQAAKEWPDSHPGTPYGYGKALLDIVKFMEGKKITKMTPEDVKEFEGKDKKEPAATTPAAAPAAPAPQKESQLNEAPWMEWWNMLHPAAIIAGSAVAAVKLLMKDTKKAIVADLKKQGKDIPDEKTLDKLANKAITGELDRVTGAGGSDDMKEGNIEEVVNEALRKARKSK